MGQYNYGFRYIAYDAENGEYQEFKTVKEAENWLTENDREGISESAVNGQNYIAEICYKSVVAKIEDKNDYCSCDDDTYDEDENGNCINCGKEERWAYSDEFDWIGKHSYEKINW